MKGPGFPARIQFDKAAEKAALEVFSHYRKIGRDFTVGGYFKKKYENNFVSFLGEDSGFAEFVCSGTAALFAILQALDFPKGSHILISPVTDPGMVNPIILSGLIPKLIDFAGNQPFPDLNSVSARADEKCKALVLNHLAGRPIPEIKKISAWAKENNIVLIEDASQCHGGKIGNRSVGTFSDVSFFSTMGTKNHSTGGAGGIIFTKSRKLAKQVHSAANKGKSPDAPGFYEKDPATFTGPALNLAGTEISAAIGLSTLKKLRSVNKRRCFFLNLLEATMKHHRTRTSLVPCGAGHAPYFGTFYVSGDKSPVTRSLLEHGIPINPDYRYLVSGWPWVKSFLADNFEPVNARHFLKHSFNLLFNENFKKAEARSIVKALLQAESVSK